MQKERAERALQHGLPAPTPVPKGFASRAWQSPASTGPVGAPSLRAGSPGPSMPLVVKLLGLGLALLGLVYGLTLFRDRKPAPETAPPTTVKGALK